MTSKASASGTTAAVRSRQHLLLGLVRGACEMLVATQPWFARTVTVSGAVDGNGSPRLVRNMTVRLAQEYGLNAEARTRGRTIVVRLSRPAAEAGLLTPDSTVV